MSRTIKINRTELTAGAAIGIVKAASRKDIIAQTEALAADPAVAAIEWRSDEYDDIFEITFQEVPSALKAVREAAKEKPLMFSFRDAVIGGKHPAKYMYIARLAVQAAKQGTDLISAPLLPYEDATRSILFEAANYNRKSVLTWIYPDRMPEEDELLKKLDEMSGYGADLIELGALAREEDEEKTFRDILEKYAQEHDAAILMSVLRGNGTETKVIL
ncbi:MAG: type I 3-dehydroquinate dehydratase [Clostridiales bacterium]|nr:type I 3-dehydroquinate dehydratase [Clostridiales bacterium]